MPLRWQLVMAFLSVSIVPVLVASLVAAQLISGLFHENMERWLGDAARFVAARAIEETEDSERAAGIVATSLTIDTAQGGSTAMDLSAELLALAGYEVVAVYDATGHVIYWRGEAAPGDWLPREDASGFFLVSEAGRPSLLLGAARRFVSNGEALFVFIGDRWDRIIIDLPGASAALQVRAFTVSGGRAVHLRTPGMEPWLVPRSVLERMAAGTDSMVEKVATGDTLASGFAALRSASGQLVGIVASRLPSDISPLSHIRTQELFVMLALGAGLISTLVALVVSRLLSSPLQALTQGLRRVGDGDYAARIEGGGSRELLELAGGFNAMAEQLNALRQREALMHRRERFAALGEAAAVIAHEIRNPLGIIKTSVEVIGMRGAVPADKDRLIGFVIDEVRRIDGLVQDLLDYVRPKETIRIPVDLGEEMDRVLDFVGPELAARQIVPLLLAPATDTIVQGDPAALHQAFLNVVINAMDAMPGGGRLTVAVAREGEEVVVSIADSGGGVDPAIRDRMFDPFVTDKPHGTGLGLARVLDVVESHGGSVVCQSTPGQGATFTLRLPAHARI